MGGTDNSATSAAAETARKNQQQQQKDNPLNSVGPGTVRQDWSETGLKQAEDRQRLKAEKQFGSGPVRAVSDRQDGLLSAGTDDTALATGAMTPRHRRSLLATEKRFGSGPVADVTAPTTPRSTPKRDLLGQDGWEIKFKTTPDAEPKPRSRINLLALENYTPPRKPTPPRTAGDPVKAGALDQPTRGALEQVKNARALQAAAKKTQQAATTRRSLLDVHPPAVKPSPRKTGWQQVVVAKKRHKPLADTMVARAVQKEYREKALLGDQLGLKNAAKSLNHYLDAVGEERLITKEEARQYKTFRKQEERIQSYYQDKTLTQKVEPRLSAMEDGETIQVQDHFDAETKILESPIDYNKEEGLHLNKAFPGSLVNDGLDFALDFGATELKSVGQINVTQWGGRAIISGTVENTIDEPYDFTSPSDVDREMRFLQAQELAKTFRIKGRWKQEVFGSADIVNGKLENVKLHWGDEE